MTRYFGRVLTALILSLALVAISAIWPSLPAWFSLAPIIPLATYHLLFLRPRAESLGSAEIDSVYYLGFLVTVATLGASAVDIAAAPETGMQPVLFKFAAGLAATGYAIVARLHLQSIRGADRQTSPEEVIDRYLTRSSALLDNLDLAVLRVGKLTETAMSEVQRVADHSRTAFEEEVLATTRQFKQQLTEGLGSAAEGVRTVRSLVAETTFVSERQALGQALQSTVAVSERLVATLATLEAGARSSAQPLGDMHEKFTSLAASTGTLSRGMAELGGENGALALAANRARSAADSSSQAAASASKAAAEIATLATTVSANGTALSDLGRAATSAGERLSGLAVTCEGFDGSTARLRDALQACQNVAAHLQAVSQSFPELASRVQSFGQQLDGLNATLGATARSLETDAKHSTTAVIQLASSLSEIAETIIDRTRERQARL